MGVRQLLEYIAGGQTATLPVSQVNVMGVAPTATFGNLAATLPMSRVNVTPVTPTLTLAAVTRTLPLSQVNAMGVAPTSGLTFTLDLSTVHVTGVAPTVNGTSVQWVFQPPVVFDVPRVLPDTTGPSYWLMRWYSNLPRGRSVLKIDGTYITVDTPTAEQQAAASVAYIGGHIYDITPEEASALAAAGYYVALSGVQVPLPPIVPPVTPPPTPAAQTATLPLSNVQARTPNLMVVSSINRAFPISTVRVFGQAPTASQVTARLLPISRVNVTPVVPTATNVSGAGPVADDFNGAALNTGLWTFINPESDSSATVGSGHLAFSVPRGTDHDTYHQILGPQVLQDVPDASFYLETKMDTSLTVHGDTMGFFAKSADGLTWVRMLIVFFSGNTYVYAGYTANGGTTVTDVASVGIGAQGAPLWLRMRFVKSTSTWTEEYSTNGTTWVTNTTFTLPLTLAKVGLIVGDSP